MVSFVRVPTHMASLAGRTILVTGGSRGIGLAIAKRAAADGANVVIAAKTVEPHPRLPGTIYTAAKECEEAGARAVLPIQVDILDDDATERMVAATVAEFGGIDILVNNASAIDNRHARHPRQEVRAHARHQRARHLLELKALPAPSAQGK